MVPGAAEHEIPLLVGPGRAASLLLRLAAARGGGGGHRRAALVLLDELRLRRHAGRGAAVVVEVVPQKGASLQCDQMLATVNSL